MSVYCRYIVGILSVNAKIMSRINGSFNNILSTWFRVQTKVTDMKMELHKNFWNTR